MVLRFQVGPDSGNMLELDIPEVSLNTLGINGLSVRERHYAEHAIGLADNALGTISSIRSRLGSTMNGLEHLSNNAQNSKLNLQAAESRMLDADLAKEMFNKTKYELAKTAALAVLTQFTAQQKNYVLTLLENQ